MFQSKGTRRGMIIGVFAGALVIVGLVILVAGQKMPTARSKPPVTIDQAQSAARAFVGKPELELTEMTATAIAAPGYYELSTKDREMSFKIDKATGAVREASLGGLNAKGVPVKGPEAADIAKTFVRDKGLLPSSDKATPTITHVGADDTAFEVYMIDWREVRDGVQLPVSLQVAVNARAGNVVSFESMDAAQLPDLTAAVSRVDAISIARSRTPFAADVRRADLQVWKTTAGEPILRWYVSLSGSTPTPDKGVNISRTSTVSINAKTGEVLEASVF